MNQEQMLLQQGMAYLQQKNYAGAFSCFLQAAQMGYDVAMNNLSVCYAKGYGTPVNRVEAFRWMKEAAEKGYPSAYYPLASKYRWGDGTPADLEKALFWDNLALQHTSSEEHQQAQQLMQELTQLMLSQQAPQATSVLDRGIQYYTAGQYNEAFSLFRAEAEKGVPAAMHNLAVCYSRGNGTAVNPGAAFQWMKRAAETGYTPSYYPLACKYNAGNGTPADSEQALIWARKAAGVSDEQQQAARELVRQLENRPDDRRFQQGMQAYGAGQYEEAFAIFKELAEQGVLGAMHNLAVCYERGRGTAADPQAAFSWLTRAAEGGYALSMHNLAVAYATGAGTKPDAQAAFRWMKASAEKGDTASYYPLACKYQQGSGTPVDNEQALIWARKAAQVQDGQQEKARKLAQFLEAKHYFRQGVAADQAGREQEAFACYQKAAEMGVPGAMNNLAVSYAKGQGTARDPQAAFRWMKAAAEKGYTASYYPLACKYQRGSGTPADSAQALAWARKAAGVANGQQKMAQKLVEQLELESRLRQGIEDYQAGRYDSAFAIFREGAEAGYYNAMFNLSVCYANGRGTAPDLQASFSWLTRAAEGGYALAMHNLAVAYAKGKGTAPDAQAAFRWMKAAAEKGDTNSYYPLACKYYFGTGTPVNLEQAAFWAKKGAALEEASIRERCTTMMQEIQRQQSGTTLHCPPQAVADYERGHRLFQEKNYAQALVLLERAGRTGHPGALYDIGYAYWAGLGVPARADYARRFFQEAAFRGSQDAIRMLATGFRANVHSAPLFQWEMYAQYHGMDGCEHVYDKGLRERMQQLQSQSRANELGPVSGSAREAMLSAARCFVEHPMVMFNGVNHRQGILDAAYYFLNAAAFGNVDGLCGYVYYLDVRDKPEEKSIRRNFLHTAAYMGSAYAMFRTAQLYQFTEPEVAKKCFAMAARWGYGSAINWCAQNGVPV